MSTGHREGGKGGRGRAGSALGRHKQYHEKEELGCNPGHAIHVTHLSVRYLSNIRYLAARYARAVYRVQQTRAVGPNGQWFVPRSDGMADETTWRGLLTGTGNDEAANEQSSCRPGLPCTVGQPHFQHQPCALPRAHSVCAYIIVLTCICSLALSPSCGTARRRERPSGPRATGDALVSPLDWRVDEF